MVKIAARDVQDPVFDRAPDGGRRLRSARESSDAILARADWLGPDDAALLRAVFADGHTALELSRLVGASPRGLRRRIRRLAARVASPLFLFVIRQQAIWPKSRRDVAAACILRGRSMRQAAEELEVPICRVRQHLDRVRTMYEAAARR